MYPALFGRFQCLIGIISIGDLVKAMIAEQQFMIEQLESYITQSPTYAGAGTP